MVLWKTKIKNIDNLFSKSSLPRYKTNKFLFYFKKKKKKKKKFFFILKKKKKKSTILISNLYELEVIKHIINKLSMDNNNNNTNSNYLNL